MSGNSLVVSEIFGPTFQGEGPHIGERVAFVRTGGCNLHCSWCDTAYTWDARRFDLRAELHREPVPVLVEKVLGTEPQRVIVSGGEPLLHQHQPGWLEMLDAFAAAGVPVDVETNGTIEPSEATSRLVACFNVSPKLAHAGDPESRRIIPAVLQALAELATQGRAVLKIVAQNAADVAQARRLAEAAGWPLAAAWVMPEGTDAQTLLDRHHEIAEAALTEGLNMTTRLHVLTWGEERAR